MPDPYVGTHYRVTATTYTLRDGTTAQAYSVQDTHGVEVVLCFNLSRANQVARRREHDARQTALKL